MSTESAFVTITADVSRFVDAMNEIARQFAAVSENRLSIFRDFAYAMDAPRRRTAMHAAYRAKTRRRNRR